MCVYIRFFKTYFKKLAYMISESGKSKIYRVGWQAEELGIASIEVQPQRSSAGRFFFCLGEVSFLFYSGPQLIVRGPPTLWKIIDFT